MSFLLLRSVMLAVMLRPLVEGTKSFYKAADRVVEVSNIFRQRVDSLSQFVQVVLVTEPSQDMLKIFANAFC
jgi:hypothetical protein